LTKFLSAIFASFFSVYDLVQLGNEFLLHPVLGQIVSLLIDIENLFSREGIHGAGADSEGIA
jgi:hypothetical protein